MGFRLRQKLVPPNGPSSTTVPPSDQRKANCRRTAQSDRRPVAESDGGSSSSGPAPSISGGVRRHERAIAWFRKVARSKEARCGVVAVGLQHPFLAIGAWAFARQRLRLRVANSNRRRRLLAVSWERRAVPKNITCTSTDGNEFRSRLNKLFGKIYPKSQAR